MGLQSFEERDYEAPIVETIDAEVAGANGAPVLVFIEGGHYDPRFVEEDDMVFAEESLRAALELATNLVLKYKKAVKIVLGVLVDNLGQECGADACSIPLPAGEPVVEEALDVDEGEENASGGRKKKKKKEKPKLPESLEDILTEYPIARRDMLVVTHERAAKNRAVRAIRNYIKSDALSQLPLDVVEESDDVTRVYFTGPDGNVLLATRNGEAWSAQCPAIMGVHFDEVFTALDKRFFKRQSSPRVVIDFSEAADRSKVTNGSKAALSLFIDREGYGTHHIFNISSVDEEVEITELDHYSA